MDGWITRVQSRTAVSSGPEEDGEQRRRIADGAVEVDVGVDDADESPGQSAQGEQHAAPADVGLQQTGRRADQCFVEVVGGAAEQGESVDRLPADVRRRAAPAAAAGGGGGDRHDALLPRETTAGGATGRHHPARPPAAARSVPCRRAGPTVHQPGQYSDRRPSIRKGKYFHSWLKIFTTSSHLRLSASPRTDSTFS